MGSAPLPSKVRSNLSSRGWLIKERGVGLEGTCPGGSLRREQRAQSRVGWRQRLGVFSSNPRAGPLRGRLVSPDSPSPGCPMFLRAGVTGRHHYSWHFFRDATLDSDSLISPRHLRAWPSEQNFNHAGTRRENDEKPVCGDRIC